MPSTSPTCPRVVIVGAGIGASFLVKELKGKELKVILIQASTFKEAPWGGPVALSMPEEHYKFVDQTDVSSSWGVEVIFGVAESVHDDRLIVQTTTESRGTVEVPFDYLVAATGFSMPSVLPTPGESMAERAAHAKAVQAAAIGGGNVVVGGGGVTAMELAANLCEAMAKSKSAGKLTVVASGSALLPGYPVRLQTKAKAVLEGLGASVILGDRVESHAKPQIGGTFEVILRSGATVAGTSLYLPSFAGDANTKWLATSVPGSTDPDSGGKVIVDEYLRVTTNPKIYALGGCAKLNESCLVGPKIEGQAKSVANNIKAAAGIRNAKLKVHTEAEPAMKYAPTLEIGRFTFAAFVLDGLPANPLVRCCGPPFNLMCPCYLCCACCGPCGGLVNAAFCCGLPCGGYPEGKATAATLREFKAAGVFPKNALGWKGLGSTTQLGDTAPALAGISRS